MKRIGIIAQCNNGGIAVQTEEFAKHIKPYKVLITDLSVFHEAAGKKVRNYPERFAEFNTRTTNGLPSTEDCEWLLEDIDVLFIVETALNWGLPHMAKERGVKTILQYNYELLDRLHPHYASYPIPDELWSPSRWHFLDMQEKAEEWGCKLRHMPVPVNREVLPFNIKRKAHTFLHIAGHPTTEDRNGTEIVMAAIPLVKNQDVRFIIRTLQPLEELNDRRVRIAREEVRNYYDGYKHGDVLLLPRRYGGLSLQVNEALSCGMPVIMPDISPNNDWLQKDWLIPATFQKRIVTRPEIDIYEITPEALAEKIDYFAALSEFTFSHWSLEADKLAQDLSWDYLGQLYRQALDE